MARKHPTTSLPRYYFDAACFIAYFANEAGRGPTVYQLLQDAEQGKMVIVTSSITLVEVLRVGTVSADGKIPTEQDINDLFERPEFELVAVDRLVAEKARDVRRLAPRLGKSRFMVADAIHIATALLSDVEALYSYDDDDLVKYDGHFEQLVIVNPRLTGQLPLPVPEMGNAAP